MYNINIQVTLRTQDKKKEFVKKELAIRAIDLLSSIGSILKEKFDDL